jgi:hypothetical protein
MEIENDKRGCILYVNIVVAGFEKSVDGKKHEDKYAAVEVTASKVLKLR